MAKDLSGPDALRAFLDKGGMTAMELAYRCGVNRSYVNRWANGDNRPNAGSALLLELVTRGAVPVKSWLNEEERETAATLVKERLPKAG